MVHVHNEILLSHEKEWTNAICSNMDGPGGYHTKQSKSDKQIAYDITRGVYSRTEMNLPIKQKQTHRHRDSLAIAKK